MKIQIKSTQRFPTNGTCPSISDTVTSSRNYPPRNHPNSLKNFWDDSRLSISERLRHRLSDLKMVKLTSSVKFIARQFFVGDCSGSPISRVRCKGRWRTSKQLRCEEHDSEGKSGAARRVVKLYIFNERQRHERTESPLPLESAQLRISL